MRIAIVAPSPNPYLVGGAENLWWGMLAYLRDETDHLPDLVKLPVKESSLPDLVAGYEAFSRLDLSGFDAVISTKYPAWMVTHPNHTVYMQHTCRGFYDWYPLRDLGTTEYAGDDPQIHSLLSFIASHPRDRAALPEFFERFRALVRASPPSSELFRHPGPVGRAIVRWLDAIGLAPSNVRRYRTIAGAVKRRPDYFPRGVDVKVVYHPTNKTGFEDVAQEYFFTASRFYPSKRIDMLIDAYRRTSIPRPFRIAGTGDEESKLRQHAGDDPRFEFMGFVRDEELVQLYNRAFAVAFAPADEDFGYITLEAMLAGKPVVTTHDAGGPLELVRDGETGLVVAPDARAIEDAFEKLHADPAWARSLGQAGAARAREITWPNLFSVLLGSGESGALRKPRPPRARITVINAYSVMPPDNGGRYRLFSLYRALSRHVDVDLVTLAFHEQGDDVIHVNDRFRELRVARTKAHADADLAAQTGSAVGVYDMTALEHIHLTPNYVTVLANSLAGSSTVVVSHPYMLAALDATGYKGRFLHEAHNVEIALKDKMMPQTRARARLMTLLEEAEGRCVRDAALTFATSRDDAAALVERYGGRAADMIVIPNGTDTRAIRYASQAERLAAKRRVGLAGRSIALFLASGHRPNLEAAQHLFNLAVKMPEVTFALVGNVADAFTHFVLPENVWRIGIVDEPTRNVWLDIADVALNPVPYGGGTNLKLLDYFAAGVPVVSTDIGIRGTDVHAGEHVLVAPIDDFGPPIRQVLAAGPEIAAMTRSARELVEREFDWAGLADRLYAELRQRELVPATPTDSAGAA